MSSNLAYPTNLPLWKKFIQKEVNNIKQTSKQGIDLLVKRGIIRNTNHGYVDKNGNDIGFYRTKGCAGKRYVKDKFVDMLGRL